MPKKKISRYRAFTGWASDKPEFKWLSRSEFLILLKVLKQPYSRGLHAQVMRFTDIYSHTNPRSKTSIAGAAAQKRIDLWIRRTRGLRNDIWKKQRKTADKPLSLNSIVKTHFKIKRGKLKVAPPLKILARTLDAALDAAEYAVNRLSEGSAAGLRETDSWMLWVSTIGEIMLATKIHVYEYHDDKIVRVEPWFVDFIEGLQEYLPEGCHRRSAREAIRKGIIEGIKRFNGLSFDNRLFLMVDWAAMGNSGIAERLLGNGGGAGATEKRNDNRQ